MSRSSPSTIPLSLIRAFEVWAPTPAGDALSCKTGFYRGNKRTASHAPTFTIGLDQGLPGQTYSRKKPVILEDLTAFRGVLRPELAARSGFSLGIGLPILKGDTVTAVVVLLMAPSSGPGSAVEIWQHDEASHSMTWMDGYYGDMNEFESISQGTTFAHGEGLPGQVFATNQPILFENLTSQRGFIRSEAATTFGLSAGLGVPISMHGIVHTVLLLLTSNQVPLGRVMEIWKPDSTGVLHLENGYYGPLEDFAAVSRQTTFAAGEGLPGRIYSNQIPVVFERLSQDAGFVRYASAKKAGLEAAMGFPVFVEEDVQAVVVLFI